MPGAMGKVSALNGENSGSLPVVPDQPSDYFLMKETHSSNCVMIDRTRSLAYYILLPLHTGKCQLHDHNHTKHTNDHKQNK